jgi:predicted regulator of Ras-like GTPase activity (Roadblock/LC7/MglB family)
VKRALLGIRSVRGVRLALVATDEGVLVASEGTGAGHPETVAALASRFLAAGKRAFEEAGRPRPHRAELRGSEGRLILLDLDGAFLAVLVARDGGPDLDAALESARARLAVARNMATI